MCGWRVPSCISMRRRTIRTRIPSKRASAQSGLMSQCVCSLGFIWTALMTIEHRLTRIAGKFWPDLDMLEEVERKHLLRELVGIIYGTLLAVLGLGWLVAATDPALATAEWPTLLLMLILAAVLNQLDFFWV